MFKTLLATAFAALALAQDTSSVLSFTRVPNPITAGQATAITYATNDTTSPVTIILRKGNPQDLTTISTLTDSATGGQYIWTPSNDLENASDYALEIKQGTQVNYFGPFQLQGSKETTPTSKPVSSGGAGGYGGVGSMTMHSSSSMMTMSSAANTTMTAPASAGTAIPMSRNATMSSQSLNGYTLTKPGQQTATSTGGSGSNTMSTGGAGFQGSQTSAPASTGGAASMTFGSSAIALVFGAVAAVFFC